MSFLTNLFSKKEITINTNEDFWKWFAANSKTFYAVIKSRKRFKEDFFDKLSQKLDELKVGYFCQTGMLNENTVELILTAEGTIKNMAFVEDLVADAPEIPGWKFTAHKPEMGIDRLAINARGYTFNKDNLSFYADEIVGCPDEISLVVAHNELTAENQKEISIGIYIFLDNYLGEIRSNTTIDDLRILPKSETTEELIPIEKLKSYLIWREKEFTEEYNNMVIDISEHQHVSMGATLSNGSPLLAAINTDLLKWDNKASHPWILKFEMSFNGSAHNGLPDSQTHKLLCEIEEEVELQFKDFNGHLYLGRETSEGVRTIYLACNEFRDCSRIAHKVVEQYKPFIDIIYDIYKDKYWQSLSQYGGY